MKFYNPIQYVAGPQYADTEILVRLDRTSIKPLSIKGIPASFGNLISEGKTRLPGLTTVCPVFLQCADLFEGTPASVAWLSTLKAGVKEYVPGKLWRMVNGTLRTQPDDYSAAQRVNLLSHFRLRFDTAANAASALRELSNTRNVAVAERAPLRYIMVADSRGVPAAPVDPRLETATRTREDLALRRTPKGAAADQQLLDELRQLRAAMESCCSKKKPSVPDPVFQHWPLTALETEFDANRGDGITVAQFDLGVDFGHQYVGSRATAGLATELYDAAKSKQVAKSIADGQQDPDGTGLTQDALNANRPRGHHGTAVAGVMAGAKTGLLPKAQVISYQVSAGPKVVHTDADGNTVKYFPVDMVLYGSALFNLGASDTSVHVVNISLGGGAPMCQMEVDGFAGLAAANILPVACSGNHFRKSDDSRVWFPARQPGVLSVGAVGIEDGTEYYRRAAFSNFSADDYLVNLMAPGVRIYTCVPAALGYADDHGWVRGTSFASPWVAALYALAVHKQRTFEIAKVAQKLQYQKADGDFDTEHGYGLAKYSKLFPA